MENNYRVAVLDDNNVVTAVLVFSDLDEIDKLLLRYVIETEETKPANIGKNWDGLHFEQNQEQPPAELVIE